MFHYRCKCGRKISVSFKPVEEPFCTKCGRKLQLIKNQAHR